MVAVMIRCPETGRAIDTGIDIEQDTFDKLPDVHSKLDCPQCGKMHRWSKGDAWLERS